MATIILTGKGSKLSKRLTEPLTGDLEMAVSRLTTYYSWPNVTSDNNRLVYGIPGGAKKTITFPPGAYEVEDLAKYISVKLKANGDKGAFELGFSSNTLKSYINVVKVGYSIHISESTIGPLLGFTLTPGVSTTLGQGEQTSQNKVDITNVQEVLVHCDIMQGVYSSLDGDEVKLARQTVLDSFTPNVAPGYMITHEPRKLNYAPVLSNRIEEFRVWLTDQSGNPIDNGTERLTVNLRVRHRK